MTGRFIRKAFVEHLREFIEHSPYGKQIDEFLDIKKKQKRPPAQKPIFLGLESEKSEIWVPHFEFFEDYMKFAHEFSVQNGSDAFPNEFTRFRFEATPIWETNLKHCKNAVNI